MYSPLQAAAAKLDRAWKDRKALHAEVRTLLDREPYRISVDREPETGWHVARIEEIEQPAPALAVLYSAIAYQCRSALNLVVWELASRKVGRRKLATNRELAGQVQFPIATSKDKFLSNGVRFHISKPALAVIEGLQPYNSRQAEIGIVEGHPLCIIKMVSDADKHRVLPGGFGAVYMTHTKFTWDESVASDPTIEPLIPAASYSLKHNTPLMRIRFERGNAKANVGVDWQPKTEVLFECGDWALTMRDMTNCIATTQRCLREMASLFPTDTVPDSLR